MPDERSAAFPPTATVTLRARDGETRAFEQSELTIDGEAALLGLAIDVGAKLTEQGFPFRDYASLFDKGEVEGFDWTKAESLLSAARNIGPDVVVDSACIMFGIFPTLEDGTRNPEWEPTRRFIRKAITFTRWVDLVRVFVAQNDYRRLAGPFSQALTSGAANAALRSRTQTGPS